MEWMDQAVCREVDPDLFFPSPGENDRTRNAKKVCGKCPVVNECLSWALARPDIVGILGGTTDRDRMHIRRKMKEQAA